MSYLQPAILVLFGVSGDLARRKLLPALQAMARAEALPRHFKIIGISRRSLAVEDLTQDPFLRQVLQLYQMDPSDSAAYPALATHLEQQGADFPVPAQKVVYFSLPPEVMEQAVAGVGQANIIGPADKLLLEKPFGTDISTAKMLLQSLHQYFDELQLYRIDHYLAKEMAQNIVTFRNSNSLFKRTWNKDFIETITISASEAIGIEGRAEFYEQTGALRDVAQNHLLQLAALVLMDLPAVDDWAAIPKHRLAALQQLQLAPDYQTQAVRAQYQGYRQAVNNQHSIVETFVRVPLVSRAPEWQDVPIWLETGKALDHKATEIRIRYRQTASHEANELVLRIEPNEGVEMVLWAKEPGYERHPHKVLLDFLYSHHFNGLPEAYERVLVDALRSDHSLFTTSDEVIAAWQLLEPMQQYWQKQPNIISYPRGAQPISIH